MNEKDIRDAIKQIDRRIKDLKELNPTLMAYEVGHDRTRVKYISSRITKTIGKAFGYNSEEYLLHENEPWINIPVDVLNEASNEKIEQIYEYEIKRCITILGQFKIDLNEDLDDIWEENPQPTAKFNYEVDVDKILQKNSISDNVEKILRGEPVRDVLINDSPIAEEEIGHTDEIVVDDISKKRDVFIVHGHEETTKLKVAEFLRELKLNPIILHEQRSKGKTIIEKIEAYSDVGFAIVLLTPDDVGATEIERDNLKERARQNVILELGYFIGKLDRENVCALYKGSIELPSDFDGVIYVSLQDDWKLKLANEIDASGIEIDFNLLKK